MYCGRFLTFRVVIACKKVSSTSSTYGSNPSSSQPLLAQLISASTLSAVTSAPRYDCVPVAQHISVRQPPCWKPSIRPTALIC